MDLIVTDQPSLVVDSGVHSTLHEIHQITYCKLNRKIVYTPPYDRLVWDFKRPDVNAITTAINQVDWKFVFSCKNVYQQVKIFNKTIIDIFSNFITNKLVTFDEKDSPWMTEKLKEKIKWKHKVCRDYLKNGKTDADYMHVHRAVTEVSQLISESKDKYYNKLSMRLNNPKTSSKTYWSILKTFYNGRKIPIIPPILKECKLESDFKIKASYFNSFFASQCTPLVNNSKLPDKTAYNSAVGLTSIKFDNNDILKIIRSLNINKAHGHDGISVGMIKMRDESLVQPLSLIFRGCIDTGVYPDTWKKSNIVPVNKKGDKEIVNNYRPVSLLPICSKILEKIIFDSIIRFLNENKLLSDAQSGFRSSDSCEYQLLSIVHDIYKSFDCNPHLEVRGIFLDISNAFDRVGMMG